MELRRIIGRMAAIGFAVCLPAFGQFFPIPSPAANYTGVTAVIPITAADATPVVSLSGGGQTISFSASMTALTAGPAGTWSFWGSPPNTESNTPRVLATPANQTSLTLTLSAPVSTFGFEIEPANSGGLPATPFLFTATFFNGTTALGTVSRSVTFNSAMLAAASSTTPITSVQITAPVAAGGWAMAQFRSGNAVLGAPPSVPAIGAPALGALALLLAGAGWLLTRSQRPA